MESKTVTRPPWPGAKPRLQLLFKTAYFCPYCGAQDMWQAKEAGEDYYLGLATCCESCQRQTDTLEDQRPRPIK